MTIFAWLVRGILLLLFFVFFLPFEIIFALVFASPVAFALGLLVLVFLALGFTLALALHVLGNLIDILLILGLIGIVWKWPRGVRGSFFDKLRISVHSLRRSLSEQVQRLSGSDLALLGIILLIVLILSLSSGLFHFLLTVAVVLLTVGVVWKWPRNLHASFMEKLRLALRALYDELRRIV